MEWRTFPKAKENWDVASKPPPFQVHVRFIFIATNGTEYEQLNFEIKIIAKERFKISSANVYNICMMAEVPYLLQSMTQHKC